MPPQEHMLVDIVHPGPDGYTYMTNSLAVSRDALVLCGWIIENDGNNALVTFHEGRNAFAPIIVVCQSLANVAMQFALPHGIELDSGLFVLFDAHTTSVTVFWRPRREREA